MKKIYFFFPLATLKKLALLFFSAFFVIGYTFTSVNAQVVLTETFTGGLLPNGWSTIKITGNDVNNDWDITNPYSPACCPLIGGGLVSTSAGNCARYKSNNIPLPNSPVNSAGLVTVPFDMSGRTGAAPFSFELYRNAFAPLDKIEVYANTSPSLAGATLLSETGGSNVIHRHTFAAPVIFTGDNWYTYTYNLPAAFNTSSTYIIIVGTAGGGGMHMYVDDFSITTWPSQMTYVSSDLFFQNTFTVASGTAGAQIVGLNIQMDGSLNPINCDSLLLVPNGTTNIANISNAKLYYTGNNNSFATTAQYGANIANPSLQPLLKFGSATQPLANGNNYFWLTYDVNGPQGNFVDADFNGSKLSDVSNVLRLPTTQSIFGAREIGVSYCIPVMSVGTAWAGYTNNDYVASVEFTGEVPGPIINSSINTIWAPGMPCSAGTCPFTSHPPDYELFPPDATHTTIIKEGGVYFPLRLKVGTWFSSNYIAAWIDWNGDGDFNDTVGGISELIGHSGSLVGSATVDFVVNVPATGSAGLINGNTTLRVREVFATSNISPCAGYTYGETEDYTVTIVGNCNAGVKTWLGFTNDWNNPANWCDQIPTSADIAVIPGKSGTPGYVMPKIQPGVNAAVKTLRIESPDTVYIDAADNASLTIADSMIIRGAVHIESGFLGSCPLGNGSFTNLTETPFAGNSSDARMQLIYTAGELFLCGMKAGDVISEIDFDIFRRRNANPYNGFTIKYFHTAQNEFLSVTNATPISPVTTVYTNFAESLAPIPINGGGIHTAVLNGAPMVWDGINNIVVDICFDKLFWSGGTKDIMFQTQTLGRNTVLLHQSQPLTNATNPGCTATGPITTLPAVYPSIISEFRPNLIFKYDRPYTAFPINQRGHWRNDGVFNAGLSNVTFDGTLGQTILGSANSTFNELTVNKTVGTNAQKTVTQNTAASVNSTLRLTNGIFDLNQKTLTVTNPDPAAIARTGGYLLSETFPPNHGILKWDIDAVAGPHSIPFGNSAGIHIPFSVNQTGGSNIGSLLAGTYPSAVNNTPYPVGVTSMDGPLAGGDNSANTVDRFWIVDQAAGGAINADLTFSYAYPGEEAALNPNDNKRPQRWVNAVLGWESTTVPGVPYSSIPGARSVLRTGVTSFISNAWTISNDVSPLPIELVVFDAKAEKDKSRIWWVTASELNVSHFTIESTTDGQVFEFIDRQESNSPSTQMQEYVTYDYAPLKGLQYYRLTSTDIDGSQDYSSLVPVYFGAKGTFDITSVFANNHSGNIDILFEYDSELPLSYVVTDVLGRLVATEENISAKKGTNLITLSTSLSKGVYIVTIMNNTSVNSKKFTY